MTLAVQIALTATPLSAYFYALGVFHSGKRPRMISGPADAGLLTLGAGALVGFGPFGQAVIGRVVGQGAGWISWTVWIGILILWSFVFAASAVRRISVYNVSGDEFDTALRAAITHLDGKFSKTLHGFEDQTRQVGITVTPSPRLHSASLETYGKDAEVLVAELKPWLKLALDQVPRRPSRFSHAMFGFAGLVIFLPVVGYFLANPRAKDALRTLLHSLRLW